MNKITASLSLSAALMLGVAQLSPPAAFAQDNNEKGSSMKEGGAEKAPASSSSASERAPDSAKKVQGSDASESKQQSKASEKSDKGDDQGKSKSASDQQDRSEKSASDKDRSKSRSADREDDKAAGKQSEGKTDEPRAKKADTEPTTKSSNSADSKKSDDGNRNADANKPSDESNRAAGADTKTDAGKADKAKSVDLTGDKKDRVKTSFKTENVKKITNVNVDISVGRRLPRDWEYHSVPTAVIDIVPEYRGYRYAYVEDRYVIVDPDTYEVVYVLDDAGGSGSASVGRSTGESGSARCASDLTFSQEDRVFIVEKVRSSSATLKIGNLEIGAELPRDAKVEVFPSEVTTRVSKLDLCRYVVIDDKVAVVDPSDDKIVAIIED